MYIGKEHFENGSENIFSLHCITITNQLHPKVWPTLVYILTPIIELGVVIFDTLWTASRCVQTLGKILGVAPFGDIQSFSLYRAFCMFSKKTGKYILFDL